MVTPVYQEDPDHLSEAVLSWMRNDVDEIIAVIDVTDEACEAVARSYGVAGHVDRRPRQARRPAPGLGGRHDLTGRPRRFRHHLGR